MTKKIPLTKGKVALVDDQDYAELSQHKWVLSSRGYAERYVRVGRKKTYVKMHRQILNAPDGMEVDHANMDKCDNRRANLRVCTTAENQWNRAANKNNTSGFKGVFFHKVRKKWKAQICANGRRLHLGSYNTPIDAAKAYGEAARKLHGDFLRLSDAGD